MTKGRIIFTGNFWEYFLISIGLIVLCVLTLGLLIPYFVYWQVKYFVTRLEIELDPPQAPQYDQHYPTQPQHPASHPQQQQRRIARGM